MTDKEQKKETDNIDDTNIFVKYLPPELTDTGLYTLFSPYGEIKSCKVMVDPLTGNSLGYGFCRFYSSSEAAEAIRKMSGMRIANKTLLCKLSNAASAHNSEPTNNLYIKPLLPGTKEEDLRELFSQFGCVRDCKVMIDKHTGLSRQIGFVRFQTIEEATAALRKMNGHQMENSSPPLVVKYAETEPQKAARRAKIIANQSAAAARNAANYFAVQQQQQQIALASLFSVGAPPVPYVVTDMYGNVTYAPTYLATPTQQSLVLQNQTNNEPESSESVPELGTKINISNVDAPTTAYNSPPQSPPLFGAYDSGSYPADPNSFGYPYTDSTYYSGDIPYDLKQSSFDSQGSALMIPFGAPLSFGRSSSRIQSSSYKPLSNSLPVIIDDFDSNPNLFVFHLPPSVDDSQLWSLFEPFGRLESVKVILDRETGQSKGYGFVKYLRMEDAVNAIAKMNGYPLDNKHLKVTFKTFTKPSRRRISQTRNHKVKSSDPKRSREFPYVEDIASRSASVPANSKFKSRATTSLNPTNKETKVPRSHIERKIKLNPSVKEALSDKFVQKDEANG